MKKFTLLFVLAFIIQTIVLSQSCLPEGITFTTQAEIDNFQANYPGCIEIEGNVKIMGDYITNLDGLSVLTYIGGYLKIIENNALTSLIGLDNLDSIGGGLKIYHNDALTSLTGLGNLVSIGGDFWINWNDALTSLTGLDNVTTIGGKLVIMGNDALTSLTGLNNLDSIVGNLNIDANDALTSLTGLEGVTTIGGELWILDNDALTSLSGLNNLISVGGELRIVQHYSLTSLSGLDNLTTIAGNLKILGNYSLTSLMGLDSLDASSINNLSITNNSSLSNCEVQSVCNYLASPNGAVNIYTNDNGCNNPAQIANACGISIPCLPYGNYYFFTQTDIDEFQTNYPGCTELAGYVVIRGSTITNLNGLNVVTSVGGDLDIRSTNALENLTGLDNLTSIEGTLLIGDFNQNCAGNGNTALNSLSGLDNLLSIGGKLYILCNYELTSLSGIDNIEAGSISDLYICYNISLSTCEVQSVCDYLASPNGYTGINSNATGCNSQAEVKEACDAVSVESLDAKERLLIYPNPLLSTATIEYELKEPAMVSLIIYNHLGQQIETLVNQHMQTGKHQVIWDAKGLPSGIYLYRLTAENQSGTGKMVVVK